MCREDHTWAVFSPQKRMNSVSVFTANLCGKVASHGTSLWQSPHATCSAQSGRQIEIVVLRQWLRRKSLFANVRQTLVANAAHHCGKAQQWSGGVRCAGNAQWYADRARARTL